MDVREKMVDLIKKASYECDECARDLYDMKEAADSIADFLITNGVTGQEWIPVKDRLPEAGEYVVCIAKRNPFSRFMPMAARIEQPGWPTPITEQYIPDATNRLPLPEPPPAG